MAWAASVAPTAASTTIITSQAQHRAHQRPSLSMMAATQAITSTASKIPG
jgi:hypothetical protein